MGEVPCFFLAGRGWFSPLASARPFLPFAVAPFLPALPFLAGASSSGSPPVSGFSTTKRYLHFGQSIFLPIRLGSRIGTIASQLGHCCLKLVVAAMDRSPPR